MNDDLSLVGTEELIVELLSRGEHVAIAMMQENMKGEGAHLYIRRHTGNSHTCIGLCYDLADCILENLNEERMPVDSDE